MLDKAFGLHRRWSRVAFSLIDAGMWIVALFLTVFLRFDFSFRGPGVPLTLGIAALAAALQMVLGHTVGPYRVSHARGSYEESLDLGRTALLTTLVLFLVVALWRPVMYPRSAPITGGALALLGMISVRVLFRAFRTRRARQRSAERFAVVFGAGFAGRRLVRSALQEDESTVLPVALLDDDPTKARMRIDGVPVRGTRKDLARVVRQTGASLLIIAAPRAKASVIRELSEDAAELGVDIKVMPPLEEIISGSGSVTDLRDLDLADLLGRRPVHLDLTVVGGVLTGRRVLVTGAGGSIGAELCRQIARFGPERLFMLDRDESGLQAVQMGLTGQGLLDSDDVVLADIRDRDAVARVMRATKPQVVFHAAALKHLPLLEQYPLEAWKTNVLGTLNVLTEATVVGVETFVNISTDKAAAPSSVLGYSKRVTEMLTAQFAGHRTARYVSVRFGNVIGSRGSVIHAFTAQIAAGGPVTVTDPEVQRFFMLISEACQLVVEAAAIGNSGDVMVLDMGEPVRIVDVARSLIRISGRRDVEITFTGLRPGEKMDEDLFFAGEHRSATGHPLITAVAAPPLPASSVTSVAPGTHEQAREIMRNMASLTRAGSTSPSAAVIRP